MNKAPTGTTPSRRPLTAALLFLVAGALPALATPALVAPARAAPPTDATGKPIPVVTGAKRVVSIGGAVTEIIYALGAQSRIVAVDTTSLYPPAAMRDHPKVGYLRMLSAEGVLSTKPDLILADGDAGPPTAIKQMRAAGAKIVILRKALDADGVAYKIRAVARALGLEAKGEALATRYTADMTRLQAAIAKVKDKPKVLFVLNIGRGSPLAAGLKTSAASIIEMAGGVNAISGYEGYKPMSPEAALAAAPDIVLVTTRTLKSMGGVDGLLGRPELKHTPAGRNRRLVAMEGLYLLGFGPRTARAVAELAAKIHPGLSLPPVGGKPAASPQ